MTAPATATQGAAPPETAAATEGDGGVQPEGAEAQDSTPERTDLNALLERRQPLKPKKKAAAKSEEPDGPDDETEEEEGEEAPDAEAKAPEPKPEEVTAEKLFTDEALETPEGIKRAREVLLHAKKQVEITQRKLDRGNVRLRGAERALLAKQTEVGQREERANKFINIGGQFMESMNIIKGAREAKPETIMAHLDKLAGGNGDHRAGTELMEQILVAVAADGKAPQPSRHEQALRSEIEQIRKQREADLAAAQAERIAIEERGLKNSIGQGTKALKTMALNANAYPAIAAAIADPQSDVDGDGVVSYLVELLEAHFEENQAPLDWGSAIGMLESKLSRFYGKRPAQAEHGSGQPIRPRQGAPRRSAPTVLPASADISNGRGRPLSHEENLAELARDPDFMGQLFGKAARA